MVGIASQSRGRGGHIARLVDHEDVVGGVGRQLGALPAYGSRRSRSRSSRRRRTGCAVVGRRGILVPAGLRCGCGRQCVVCPRRKAAVAASSIRSLAGPGIARILLSHSCAWLSLPDIAPLWQQNMVVKQKEQSRSAQSTVGVRVVVWEGDVAAGSINVQVVKDEN